MESAERKDFRKPDEVRQFPMGRLELINVGGAMVGRAVFDPGWRWSTSVQPLVKTKSCEAPHVSSTMFPACCESGWTMARSSTASRATCRCYLPGMMPGWWATSRRSWSIFRG